MTWPKLKYDWVILTLVVVVVTSEIGSRLDWSEAQTIGITLWIGLVAAMAIFVDRQK